MKIIGVIPARGGSKGIPGKNIKLLKGKPLIAYTIEAALASRLDRVVVSTDCNIIAEISENYGAEVIIRPECLAEDTTPTLPVIQNVINRINGKFDAVMTLQPTSPLRTAKHINEAIELFRDDKLADSLVSVIEVPHNYIPEKLMSFDGRYLSGNLEVKRRQDTDIKYARNGAAIYITKIQRLSEYLFGGRIIPYFMHKIDSFDIDDEIDLFIVSRIMNG